MAVIIALVGTALLVFVWRSARTWRGTGIPLALAEAQVKGRKARAAIPPAVGLAVYLSDTTPGPGGHWYRPGTAPAEWPAGPISAPQPPLS